VAEGGGLLNRYRGLNPYRGFESPSLRQDPSRYVPEHPEMAEFRHFMSGTIVVRGSPISGSSRYEVARRVSLPWRRVLTLVPRSKLSIMRPRSDRSRGSACSKPAIGIVEHPTSAQSRSMLRETDAGGPISGGPLWQTGSRWPTSWKI
jgi:hypothetical protein